MEYKECLQQIQKYLEDSPLIILGSGSSSAHGLPVMNDLSDEIKKHGSEFDKSEFDSLCKNLDSTMDLEKAIDQTTLSYKSFDAIRKIVWKCINERDMAVLNSLKQNKYNFALANLFKIVTRPAPNTATVVTTNYDRLAEYAIDLIGATTVTGFEGNLIRSFEFPLDNVQNRRIERRERVVNLWKVHGSLDWFSKEGGDIVSFPLSTEIPLNHSPLIIAPGKGKYNFTHNEPYRDIIFQSDKAFSKAVSFLCIGYGFNDEHIQPKLINQIKNGKPIVVLSKEVTEACKQNVVSADVKKFVIIEHLDDKTLVTGSGYKEIYDGNFWKLPDFIKTIWE